MIRRYPLSSSLGYGMGLPLLFVLTPTVLAGMAYPYVFASNLLAVNWLHFVSNLFLLGVLGLAYVVWLVLVVRRAVSAATGLGFTVAGLALAMRILCEFRLSGLGVSAGTYLPALGTLVQWVRGGGLVGFAFGLAVVAASCVAERRLRRTGPEWILPS